MREFARDFYLVGVLALAVFAPLQIADSGIPADGPPALPVAAVVGLGLAAVVGIVAVGFLGYRWIWGEAGWIDRHLDARKKAKRAARAAVAASSPPDEPKT